MVVYRGAFQRDLEREALALSEWIARTMDPDRIVLFGSVARGEAGPRSDVDLIVVKDSPLTFKERMRLIYTEMDAATDVDVFWYTPDEARRLVATSSFVREAFRTGRVLHERA